MKGWGIFFEVMGALNLIASFVGMGSGAPGDWLVGRFVSGFGFLILGLFMINRANEKKQEKEDKDKWLNS